MALTASRSRGANGNYVALMRSLVRFCYLGAEGIFITRDLYPQSLQALRMASEDYKLGSLRNDLWKLRAKGLDAELDNTHLLRMAGRFSRRVRGWAQGHGVPVLDCKNQERKHEIAEEFLKKNACVRGVFLILVGRAPATVWNVQRSKSGVIVNLEAKRFFISF